MIIGGWGAVETDSIEELKRNQAEVKIYSGALEEGIDSLVELLVKYGISPSEAKDRAYSTDWKAIIALKKYVEHIGFDEYLPSVKTPCLFFAGEDDSSHSDAMACVDMMDDTELVTLAGLNHAQAFRQSHLILPQIQEFLSKQINP